MTKRNTKTPATVDTIDPALIAALAAKLGYVRPDAAPAVPANGLELAHWYDVDREIGRAHV